jgi:hypothetical protein
MHVFSERSASAILVCPSLRDNQVQLLLTVLR